MTTETLLNDMANAASMGCRCCKNPGTPAKGYSIPAATGIKIILYPNAQNRFCLAVFMVARLKFIARRIPDKLPLVKITSADSMAT